MLCRGKVQRVADIVHKAKAAKEGGATHFVCPRENADELLQDSSGVAAGLTVLPVDGLVDLVRHSIGHASPIANDDAACEFVFQ
jgi:PDZ domain-containing secreted protein